MLRTNSWMSLAGVLLAVTSGVAAIFLLVIDFLREYTNPYLGILTYLVAPGLLLLGIAIAALGAWRERRRRRRMGPSDAPGYPRIDLNDGRVRRSFLVAAVVTLMFLFFSALGSYRAFLFTESVTFCGKTCHSVMKPEYTTYQGSPHARVACVECHIGPGATWFVRSKLSGAYQVYATLADKYPRPVPAPIRDLRPAQETCEQCHWPQKFFGGVQKTLSHTIADEANSPWTLQLLLKTGGGDPRFGPVGGIHWHMNIANRIEYVAADRQRQTIPWVRLTRSDGSVTIYQSTDHPMDPAQLAATRPRVFDCIDCHNRPTHIYDPPSRAVDLAFGSGRVTRELPFLKLQVVKALTAKYATESEALRGIQGALSDFYRTRYPAVVQGRPGALEQAIAAAQEIYRRSFFPEMRADWRSYPDNIGHFVFIGCYRCHDGGHASAEGKTIVRDCNVCHTLVAQGGDTPLKSSLSGLEFEHPVDIGDAWRQANCSDCHDGTVPQ